MYSSSRIKPGISYQSLSNDIYEATSSPQPLPLAALYLARESWVGLEVAARVVNMPAVGSKAPRGDAKPGGGWLLEKSTGSVCTLGF